MSFDKSRSHRSFDQIAARNGHSSIQLRQNAVNKDEEEHAESDGLILSQTMTRTIQHLEHLVDEASQLAEMVGAPDHGQQSPGPTSDLHKSSTARPTLGLAEKIGQYIQKVSTQQDHVGFPDNCDSPQASRDKTRTEEETRRNLVASPAQGLQILPPDPVAEALHEKKSKLHRDRRSTRGLSSASKVAGPFLSPPHDPRAASSADWEYRGKTRYPLPTPTIKLNDEELKEGPMEESEPLLEYPNIGHERHFSQVFGIPSRHVSISMAHPQTGPTYKIDLKGARHVDIPESADDLNVHSTCHHAPVARNWPISRKRFSAWTSCVNTACVGILTGIYAGEVPAIQYVIVDLDRQIILGNVFLYLGLAVSTLIFWPLPLLHGRKPYTLVALVSALCLQIPQGVMVLSFRDPDVARYRVVLLLSRAAMGFVLGFVSINNFATLLDVFGASLQSDESREAGSLFDVRRHGGGMGIWLAMWSWCTTGSISIGFLIGAFIINSTSVEWGFWVSALVLVFVILLNIIAPEVRRSAFRRTISEITGVGGRFSRVARGEVKLHLTGNGPYWWGEEVLAALRLSWRMAKQPGFLVLSIYAAWVYAQFSLVLMVSSFLHDNFTC